jgi:pilus assembly protein Flp/PilA
MRTLIQRLWTMRSRKDERGAALTEYGILLALIAAVVIGVITTLGTHIKTVFQSIIDKI